MKFLKITAIISALWLFAIILAALLPEYGVLGAIKTITLIIMLLGFVAVPVMLVTAVAGTIYSLIKHDKKSIIYGLITISLCICIFLVAKYFPEPK